MKRINTLFYASFVLLGVVTACTAPEKDDAESRVRTFLADFQQLLGQSESEVLKVFEARQSRESLLNAIAVLQNKVHEFVWCEADFSLATVTAGTDAFKVTVPVSFRSRDLEKSFEEKTSLVIWLKPDKNSFAISRLDGDEFYTTFARLKNDIEWLVDRQVEITRRKPYYDIAKAIQQNYDSVIWFTEWKGAPYFYVVSGDWINSFRNYDGAKSQNARMGLVDQDGNVVIPVEYDLIRTLSFDLDGITEVKRAGKTGYFDLVRKTEVVPPVYDMVIPYRKNDIFCIVRRDSVYGWYDNSFTFSPGFPSAETERFVKDFTFLPKRLRLAAGHYALCEIPSEQHAGHGIIMPSSYLVMTGIFSEFISGISPTPFPLEGWTDYVETEGSVFTRITEGVSALITTVRERYLEGRQEFYEHNRLAFIGPALDTLAVTSIGAGGAVNITRIDSLLEVRYAIDEEYYFEGSYWPDVVPLYQYFVLSADMKVTPLKTPRSFAQTQFVILDSSYFRGSFRHFTVTEKDGLTHYGYDSIPFISTKTVRFMRDEILASYGFKFDDEELNQWFYAFRDLPRRSREEIEQLLTDTDRHNVVFLESLLPSREPAI
jgi:hypothetical protein